MVPRAALGLFFLLAIATGGCASPPDRVESESANMARMAATKNFQAKRRIARQSCLAAGLDAGTRHFARCVATYRAWDAAHARAMAHTLSGELVRRHGLCIDPVRFELANCLDI